MGQKSIVYYKQSSGEFTHEFFALLNFTIWFKNVSTILTDPKIN